MKLTGTLYGFPWRDGPIGEPQQIALTSEHDGVGIGIIVGMTDGGVTYLTDLYVHPDYRNQGRGTELVKRFLEAAGDTTVVLLTRVATEFYRKLGFEERPAMVWRKK